MSGIFKSLVSNTAGGSGVTFITSPSFTCAAGDTIIIVGLVGSGSNLPFTSVTDTFPGSNVWATDTGSHIFTTNLFGGVNLQIWWAPVNVGGTGTVTGNWSGANGGFSQLFVGIWTNLKPSPFVIANNIGATAANPSLTTGAGNANDLVIASIVSAQTISWGANMTNRDGVGVSYGSANAPSTAAFTITSTAVSGFYIAASTRFSSLSALNSTLAVTPQYLRVQNIQNLNF